MKKIYSFVALLLIFASANLKAQTLLTESFDTGLNWTVAHPVGTSTNDGWTQVTTGNYPDVVPFAGAGMAKFNAFSINVPNSYSITSPAITLTGESYQVKFKMYRDDAYPLREDKVEVYISETPDATGATLLGTVHRNSGMSPVVSANGWYSYTFNIPDNPTGEYYISLLAVTAYGNNMYVDEVEVGLQPAVAPICATAFVATPNTCGNFENSISWTAATDASSYLLSIGTESGATDILDNEDIGDVTSYSFSGTPATTYYYTVTPINSFGPADGCEEQSFTTADDPCYCQSEPSSYDGDGITHIIVGASEFDIDEVTYEDLTDTVIDLPSGISTNVEITFETYYGYQGHIWIDFNDDYDFTDPGELVHSFESANWQDVSVVNASFIMPASAPLGEHRMRIGTADSGQDIPDSCYMGSYGVSIDLVINLIEADCAPAVATTSIAAECDQDRFFVVVNVTELGDGTPVITDGTTEYPITETGIIEVGPYDSGSTVSLMMLHGLDDVCNVSLGIFTYTCPPANDDCSNAIALTVTGTFQGGTVGHNNGATGDDEYDGNCGGYNGGDVWYSVIVPESGNVTIETAFAEPAESDDDDNFDSVITAYYGVCGDLTPIGCNDDGAGSGFSKLVITGQEALSVIYIQVYEYSNDEPGDSFTISAYDASLSNEEFTASAVKVYPNPVNGILNVSNIANINDIEVYNMLGQKVNTVKAAGSNAQVDMSALTQGTYIVRIITSDSVETVKVVKQ